MHILTFDTEEWFIEKTFKGGRLEKYCQYDDMLSWILDVLDEYHLKATFFCVGELAVQFPDVVRKIAEKGHEIGCHGNRHMWITKMTEKEFAEDTKAAVTSLSNLIGVPIQSYRAPAFSINEKNAWAFEILAENGIKYDCSVFPADRDFGGFPQFKSSVPSLIYKGNCVLKEFPICPASFGGKPLPFSGGGYFRLIPMMLQEHFIDKMDYVMFYFHINDLINQKAKIMSRREYEDYFKESGTIRNRVVRYVKGNIGKGDATGKLKYLLKKYDFCNVEEAANTINWENQPKVHL